MRNAGLTIGLALALFLAGRAAFAGDKPPPKQFSGVAAYYDTHYHGRTAAGEQYDPAKFTAAHRTLPFGTRLKVTDRRTGRSVEVVVNDRGPFTGGRVLDLSLAAARQLKMIGRGLTRVTASVEGVTPPDEAAAH
jgi:rare lipoprotein A